MSRLDMQILVVPDDDKRMREIAAGCMGTDGVRFFVRESQWAAVREAMRQQGVILPESKK